MKSSSKGFEDALRKLLPKGQVVRWFLYKTDIRTILGVRLMTYFWYFSLSFNSALMLPLLRLRGLVQVCKSSQPASHPELRPEELLILYSSVLSLIAQHTLFSHILFEAMVTPLLPSLIMTPLRPSSSAHEMTFLNKKVPSHSIVRSVGPIGSVCSNLVYTKELATTNWKHGDVGIQDQASIRLSKAVDHCLQLQKSWPERRKTLVPNCGRMGWKKHWSSYIPVHVVSMKEANAPKTFTLSITH
jgi:hypothetical protein